MSTMFGTYTNYGYAIHLYHDGQTKEIYRAGNCIANSSQVLPPGTSGTMGLWDIGKRCERIGVAMADERGVQWTGCRFDEDKDNRLKSSIVDYPFWCHLCNVSFMTKPELDRHQHSAFHIFRLGGPSPFSVCTD